MQLHRLAVAVAALLAAPLAGAASAAAPKPAAQPVAAAPGLDDDATVCVATAKTVSDGLNGFVADMKKVSTLAGQGDLASAEGSVRDGGSKLIATAEQLHKDAQKADNITLRTAIKDLANEFQRRGESLDDLTGLQTFDTTRLDELAERMSSLCDITPRPEPSPSAVPSVTAAR
jgi:hypothetical protein